MKAQHLTEAQLSVVLDLFNSGRKIMGACIHGQSGEGNMLVTEEVEQAVKGETGTTIVYLGVLTDDDYRHNTAVVNIQTHYYSPTGEYLGNF